MTSLKSLVQKQKLAQAQTEGQIKARTQREVHAQARRRNGSGCETWGAPVGSHSDCTELWAMTMYLNDRTTENKGTETFGIIKIKINLKIRLLWSTHSQFSEVKLYILKV